MNTLTNVQTTDLINLLENITMEQVTGASTAITTQSLTNDQARALNASISNILVRRSNFNRKQALVASAAFIESFPSLAVGVDTEWQFDIIGLADTGFVNGEAVSGQPIIEGLLENDFIEISGDDTYACGAATIKALNTDRKGLAPVAASIGINEDTRTMRYGIKTPSKLLVEAIEILESTESVVSVDMLNIANQVIVQLPTLDDRYVINGCNDLVEAGNIEVVTEFKSDKRGRLYQAAFKGFNGQSSDMARSFQDLANVSTDYNIEFTLELLMKEIEDMTSLRGAKLQQVMARATANPVKAIIACVSGKMDAIKKPWNFVKFSKLILALQNGERPYIGVAIGFDAKCSGPQIAALMCNDVRTLKATGFSAVGDSELDTYQLAISECEKVNICGLTRSAIKKPYMAVFYGASRDAMLEEVTINTEAFEALYSVESMSGEVGKRTSSEVGIAEKLHNAVCKTFGSIQSLRNSIGGCKELNSALTYRMPDGLVVDMNYRFQEDINGDLITKDTILGDVEVVVGNSTSRLMKPKFTTDVADMVSSTRTGFVNMIQAMDALVARLVIKHANELGATHIVSIHDCFRVNIHDTAILTQAIKLAYKELFGNISEGSTENLETTDMLGNLSKGLTEASSDKEFSMSQFNTRGTRYTRFVGSTKLSVLISQLGEGHNNTFYFAK